MTKLLQESHNGRAALWRYLEESYAKIATTSDPDLVPLSWLIWVNIFGDFAFHFLVLDVLCCGVD